jgi:hypothetical protein
MLNRSMGTFCPVKEIFMKTAIMVNHTIFVAGATAVVALAALGFAGSAHAQDDVYWSVGVGAPGVSLSVGNAGPMYRQPEAIYYQPAPIYYQPRQIHVQPQAVYYERPHGWNRRHGGRYIQESRRGYDGGYYGARQAPVTQVDYRHDGRFDGRNEGRR